MLLWLIRQYPFRLRVAILTSSLGIPSEGQGDARGMIPFVIRSGYGIERACLASSAQTHLERYTMSCVVVLNAGEFFATIRTEGILLIGSAGF